MGGRLEVGFQELLPHNSSRRTACRALSHVLGELALQSMQEGMVVVNRPYTM